MRLTIILLSVFILTGCLSERKRAEIEKAAQDIVAAAALLPPTPQTEAIRAAAAIITAATSTSTACASTKSTAATVANTAQSAPVATPNASTVVHPPVK